MADPAIHAKEVTAGVKDAIAQDLAATLALKTCKVGSDVRLPAPKSFSTVMNAVYVRFASFEVEDAWDQPAVPQGFAILYHLEILYFRLQQDGENPDEALAADLSRIGSLFLGPRRKLPGVLPTGRVERIVPVAGGTDTPFAAINDTPELRTSVGAIRLAVYTRV